MKDAQLQVLHHAQNVLFYINKSAFFNKQCHVHIDDTLMILLGIQHRAYCMLLYSTEYIACFYTAQNILHAFC